MNYKVPTFTKLIVQAKKSQLTIVDLINQCSGPAWAGQARQTGGNTKLAKNI